METPKGRPFVIVDCPRKYEKWGPRAKYQRRKQDKERANRCSAKRREKEEKGCAGRSWGKERASQPGVPGSGNGWGMSNVQLGVVVCAVTPLSSPPPQTVPKTQPWVCGAMGRWANRAVCDMRRCIQTRSSTHSRKHRHEAEERGSLSQHEQEMHEASVNPQKCLKDPGFLTLREAGGPSHVVQYYRKGEPCDSEKMRKPRLLTSLLQVSLRLIYTIF